jgi:peptidoglycan/LPS O-acetylase OafA/YrhL
LNPVSPIPAIALLLVALATCSLLVKKFGASPDQGRFTTIDGLRGYLAFFVFLHHSCIWYFYLQTDQWKAPPSNLYTHLGESSVLLFFMITGLLFFSKLIDGRTKRIDWGRLFVSRFLRLVPLYMFLMCLLFLVIAHLSNGALNEPIPKIMMAVLQWLGFTIFGNPDLNGIEHTSRIISGVTWSLPYEWFFYFSLPILALTVRTRPPLPYIIIGVISAAGLASQLNHMIIAVFFSGIAASLLSRLDSVCQFASRSSSSFITIGCIAVAIILYPSAHSVVPCILLSVAFVLIASGNSLFGVLVSPVSRILGQYAYGIYLLHGITLFATFTFVLGIPESKALSTTTYWLVVTGITPILIFTCFLTFRYIEHPAMQSTTAVTAWLRSRLTA